MPRALSIWNTGWRLHLATNFSLSSHRKLLRIGTCSSKWKRHVYSMRLCGRGPLSRVCAGDWPLTLVILRGLYSGPLNIVSHLLQVENP